MSKKQILLVDDDRDLTRGAKAFLENRGYAVEIANNGAEAWQALNNKRPDLIVLDIMMDYDAEGFNLAYKLKEDQMFKQIPILICSGYSQHLNEKLDKFEFVLGRDWPADAIIEKPANLQSIADKIESLLKAQQERKVGNLD